MRPSPAQTEVESDEDEAARGAAAFQARPDVQPNGFTNAMMAALDDEEF